MGGLQLDCVDPGGFKLRTLVLWVKKTLTIRVCSPPTSYWVCLGFSSSLMDLGLQLKRHQISSIMSVGVLQNCGEKGYECTAPVSPSCLASLVMIYGM